MSGTRRHVNKTGDIKDFVITEESGIAKGIRRVVAVTGNEAAEVRRVADGLSARLDQLDAMEGKEKDTGLKAFQVVSARVFVRRPQAMLTRNYRRNSARRISLCSRRRSSPIACPQYARRSRSSVRTKKLLRTRR